MTSRTIIAYQQVLGPVSRMMAEGHAGKVLFTVEDRRKPPGLGVFWCAADRPEAGGLVFRTALVYLTRRGRRAPYAARGREGSLGRRNMMLLAENNGLRG